MKFIYPAVFQKKEDGGYHGYFPDLACCEADGPDLEETIEKANEACYDWITLELEEEKPFLPPVSDDTDIELKENEVLRHISVNIKMYEGWEE